MIDVGDEREDLVCSYCDCEEMDLIAYLNARRKRLKAASLRSWSGDDHGDEQHRDMHMHMIQMDQMLTRENLSAKIEMEDKYLAELIEEESTYN